MLTWWRISDMMGSALAYCDDSTDQEGRQQDSGLADEDNIFYSRNCTKFNQIQLGSKKPVQSIADFVQEKAGNSLFENFFEKVAALVEAECNDVIDHRDKVYTTPLEV